MALPRKLMIDGETTVAETRTHVKVLAVPFVILVLVSGATAYLATEIGGAGDGVARWVVIGIGLALIVVGAVLPWLRWITWTYTLTNLRIVEQKGILTRTGRVIPLSRINDVAYEKNLNDRILGCGTLVVQKPLAELVAPRSAVPCGFRRALHRGVGRCGLRCGPFRGPARRHAGVRAAAA